MKNDKNSQTCHQNNEKPFYKIPKQIENRNQQMECMKFNYICTSLGIRLYLHMTIKALKIDFCYITPQL